MTVLNRFDLRQWIAWLPLVLAMAAGAGPASAEVPQAVAGCPVEASRVVGQLYSWYVQVGDHYRDRLQEQKKLFEPSFYNNLEGAFKLQPSEQGFLDFDPFNGAQVSSYGYRLTGCRALADDRLEARVAVRRGLGRDRAADALVKVQLHRQAAGWRIRDFYYAADRPEGSDIRLQPLLDRLLASQGQVLNTPGFRIVVKRLCPEGMILCDLVSYTGVERSTGATLRLKGSTTYHHCSDGTPCRFLGYSFRNGDYLYWVGEEGELRVSRSGKLLLSEPGEWQQ